MATALGMMFMEALALVLYRRYLTSHEKDDGPSDHA